ncbi:MAG: cysteine synthase A [Myxococcota bacterium]|jgi:cysteine synthase A
MHASALDAIGHTPLIALDRVHPGPGRVVAKAEYSNPGGSIKDRAARQIVLDARESGALAPGGAVLEMTSGNMGAGLAVVCAVLGHPLVAVMSAGNSPARARMLEGLGAEVVLVPQVDGRPGQVTGRDVKVAAAQARILARDRGAFYVDQFFNPGSVRAHERTTGPEIWDQTERLDAFVACVGSGGTFVGTMRALRPHGVQGVAVEPAKAAVLSTGRVDDPRHVIQGCGYGVVPPKWEPALCDRVETVTDAEVSAMRRTLATREGLYVGFSAAANVVAACRTAARLGEGAVVATVLCDTGLKY